LAVGERGRGRYRQREAKEEGSEFRTHTTTTITAPNAMDEGEDEEEWRLAAFSGACSHRVRSISSYSNRVSSNREFIVSK
jgi:hypothetical protein